MAKTPAPPLRSKQIWFVERVVGTAHCAERLTTITDSDDGFVYEVQAIDDDGPVFMIVWYRREA